MEVRLRVPEDHEPALAALAQLDKNSFQQVMDDLSGQEGLTQANLATSFATALESRLADSLAEAVLGLSIFRLDHGYAAVDVVDAVLAAGNFDATAQQLDALGEYLLGVLECSAVTSASKAIGLSASYDRRLHRVRLITDLRPILSTDAALPPTAALIVHQLELQYYGAAKLENTTFALQSDQLRQLKEQVDRALEKQSSLEKWLSSVGLRVAPELEDER